MSTALSSAVLFVLWGGLSQTSPPAQEPDGTTTTTTIGSGTRSVPHLTVPPRPTVGMGIGVVDPITGRSRYFMAPRGESSLAERAPPPLVEPDAIVRLPGVVSDVVVGGGGRSLLLAMSELQKTAVFDVRSASVLKYVDVESDRFTVAAGATRFIVVDPV